MTRLNPVNYKIRLDPDMTRFRFEGMAEILMKAEEPVEEIRLNILDLAVWSCRVKTDEGPRPCPFLVHPQNEQILISLPGPMTGEITIQTHYTGRINDGMAGFYRSRYRAGSEDHYIAVTQFEESDARRAFPCFDHPLMKATFDIVMLVDEDLTALSNMPVMEERAEGKGRKRVIFQQTPRMSTYLLFFGLGKFEFIDDPGDVLLRSVALPGLAQYGEYGLAFGRKSLEFCAQTFGTPYPLPKLDLIAVPDFAFGAMENWGAVTFRENLLLRYPEITSRAGEERICQIVAHEIVHQWFGNLVTPSDWKYLWLNESFATYFGNLVVAHYHPEWGIWEQFLQGQAHTAMERDSLRDTLAIEIPGGEHVVINISTAPVIYSKGACILRQAMAYVGDECFQEGLKSYLHRHQYSCTSSHHLWESLEEVSDKPVVRMMENWIGQPGFPLLHVGKEGDRLVCRQKRFSYLPLDSNQTWLIPVSARLYMEDGSSKTVSMLMEDREAELKTEVPVAAYKVNDAQTGFYRVFYDDPENMEALGRLVFQKKMPPEDRWGIQNDLYAMVQAGMTALPAYLDFLAHYTREEAFLPVSGIAGNIFHAFRVAEGPLRDLATAAGRELAERMLDQMGLEPDPNEKHTASLLRDRLMKDALFYESERVLPFATGRFAALREGASIHPDIVKNVMQAGAFESHPGTFDWFVKRLHTSESEHERMNMLEALGMFRDRSLIEQTLEYVLEKVPDRNKFVPVGAMAANPHAAPVLWDWFRANWEKLERLHPLHYERVIAAIVPVCGLGREKEVRDFFDNYTARKNLAKGAIRLSLERLEVNARMRG